MLDKIPEIMKETLLEAMGQLPKTYLRSQKMYPLNRHFRRSLEEPSIQLTTNFQGYLLPPAAMEYPQNGCMHA